MGGGGGVKECPSLMTICVAIISASIYNTSICWLASKPAEWLTDSNACAHQPTAPNSAAHCRDCQCRLNEGDVRVGAHVFSSSARHAGYGINYWCLECMCARPAIKRMARLNPTELEKVLPGRPSRLT
jgi:hypothetical protein